METYLNAINARGSCSELSCVPRGDRPSSETWSKRCTLFSPVQIVKKKKKPFIFNLCCVLDLFDLNASSRVISVFDFCAVWIERVKAMHDEARRLMQPVCMDTLRIPSPCLPACLPASLPACLPVCLPARSGLSKQKAQAKCWHKKYRRNRWFTVAVYSGV